MKSSQKYEEEFLSDWLDYNTATDEEVVSRNYDTNDPESLDGLVNVLPPDHLFARPEMAYDVKGRSRDNMVWCTHCQRYNHYKGFVMRTESGVRFLIGIDCGEKIYGCDFVGMLNNLTGLRDRKTYLERAESLKKELPLFIQYLKDIAQYDNTVLAFDAMLKKLSSSLRFVRGPLIDAAQKHNGQLKYDEKIRDFAAEERRQEEYDAEISAMTLSEKKRLRKEGCLPTVQTNPIYRYERRSFSMQGKKLFENISSTSAVLTSSIGEIEKVLQELKGQNSNQKYAQIYKRLREALDAVENEFDRYKAAHEFFSPKSLRIIEKWWPKAFPNSVYALEPGPRTLIKRKGGRVVAQVSLPLDYKILDKERIQRLRSRVSQRFT